MRPPARPQSALRHPLNTILGRESHVRVLRVLALDAVPVGRTELATLAQLQPRGMKKLLESLEDAGVIESVGRGRRQSFRLRQGPFFVNALQDLFAQERERENAILGSVGQIVSSQGPSVRAAWIEGAVAHNTDKIGDAINLTVLAAEPDDEPLRRNVRALINDLQRRFDIPIELKVLHQADLDALAPAARAELERTQSVSGPPPRHFLEPLPTRQNRRGPRRTHADQDAALLERARAIAARIAVDSSVVTRAKRWIEERRTVATPGEQVELSEWHDILDTMSPARVRRLLTQPGERATRLRQSMPFVEESR